MRAVAKLERAEQLFPVRNAATDDPHRIFAGRLPGTGVDVSQRAADLLGTRVHGPRVALASQSCRELPRERLPRKPRDAQRRVNRASSNTRMCSKRGDTRNKRSIVLKRRVNAGWSATSSSAAGLSRRNRATVVCAKSSSRLRSKNRATSALPGARPWQNGPRWPPQERPPPACRADRERSCGAFRRRPFLEYRPGGRSSPNRNGGRAMRPSRPRPAARGLATRESRPIAACVRALRRAAHAFRVRRAEERTACRRRAPESPVDCAARARTPRETLRARRRGAADPPGQASAAASERASG